MLNQTLKRINISIDIDYHSRLRVLKQITPTDNSVSMRCKQGFTMAGDLEKKVTQETIRREAMFNGGFTTGELSKASPYGLENYV